MLKNFLFDMDGTLIDCAAEEFIPLYRKALLEKFAGETEVGEIVQAILTGGGVMVANDGTRTNREVFMAYARGRLAMSPERLEEKMTEFYNGEYAAVKKAVTPKPDMIAAIKLLKEKKYRLVVTTNPLFPESALVKRLEWGGFRREDFDFVTSYETSRYAKPSLGYYTEVLARLGLDPAETMIVGNDMKEDIAAGRTAGMQAYWLTDSPIDAERRVAPDREGKSADFLAFVNSL